MVTRPFTKASRIAMQGVGGLRCTYIVYTSYVQLKDMYI